MNPMEMIKTLQETQNRLKEFTVEGESGAGMVKIVLDGQYSVLDVKISKDVINPDEPEVLEDLVLSACTDALEKIKLKIHEQVSSLAGGLNIPPGMMGL